MPKKTDARLDRPFAPRVLQRARRIARGYRLILEPHEELGYLGHCEELPTVLADGPTPEACARATLETAITVVAVMLESKQPPPAPVSK